MKKAAFQSALLATIALALPQAANATLLVGFHDGSTPANKDAGSPDFTGSITGSSNLAGWNSTDGTYGPDSAPGVSGAPVATGTSFGFGGSGPRTISMVVTNTSLTNYALGYLLFDFTNDKGFPTNYAVSYSLSGGPSNVPLIPSTASAGTVVTGNGLNWLDVSKFLGITLNSLQTITFKFDTTNGGAIDNIAISAIPEPASLLALGCVLGSGLMVRNRRSRPSLV